MSRRARALAFLLAALLAAALAAAVADGYGARVAAGYGPLRPAVVASRGLAADRALGPAQLGAALEVRRVPARFVPRGALAAPREALGLAPQAAVPAGAYLLAAQLRPPRAARRPGRALAGDRRPVEIAVSGAEALAAGASRGARVDVVVTAEPRGAGPGRTYVAVAGVPLLALGPAAEGPGPAGASAATLALTRRQALRLIGAESYARRLTLIPAG